VVDLCKFQGFHGALFENLHALTGRGYVTIRGGWLREMLSADKWMFSFRNSDLFFVLALKMDIEFLDPPL